MGSSSSKKKKGAGGGPKPAKVKGAANHGPLPQEIVPYAGPIVQYRFMEVIFTIQLSFFDNHLTTKVEDYYYQLLGAQYAEGFVLVSIVRVPGTTQKPAGIIGMDGDVDCPHQGIFTRFPKAPTPDRWQLKIEKSLIHFQGITTMKILQSASSQTAGNTSHLIDLIASNAANGCRLTCMFLTGTSKTEDHKVGFTGNCLLEVRANSTKAVGVDLFFNAPLHPNPTMYMYTCVVSPVPIQIQWSMGTMDTNFDFNAQLQMHLSQGYRLVEVCLDPSSSSSMYMDSAEITWNSVWFFEKEAARVNDNTPVYEGRIVEHYMDITPNLVSGYNWSPLMEMMGNKGWDFACSLITPKTVRRGMYPKLPIVLLFFQRKLDHGATGAPIGFIDPSTSPLAKEWHSVNRW